MPRQLSEIAAISAFEVGYRSIARTSVKEQRDYCLSFLAHLAADPEFKSGSSSDALIASAYVRTELAETVQFASDVSTLEEIIDLALGEAEASQNDEIRFHTLFCSGMLLERHGSPRGVLHLQRAIVYAGSCGHWEVKAVISKLGEIWAMRAETMQNAILMFEWYFQLDKAPYSELLQKYTCIVKFGDRSVVEEQAKYCEQDSCFNIGATVAARLALGRRQSAFKLAEKGIALADKLSDSAWKNVFEILVNAPSRKRDQHGKSGAHIKQTTT